MLLFQELSAARTACVILLFDSIPKIIHYLKEDCY